MFYINQMKHEYVVWFVVLSVMQHCLKTTIAAGRPISFGSNVMLIACRLQAHPWALTELVPRGCAYSLIAGFLAAAPTQSDYITAKHHKSNTCLFSSLVSTKQWLLVANQCKYLFPRECLCFVSGLNLCISVCLSPCLWWSMSVCAHVFNFVWTWNVSIITKVH